MEQILTIARLWPIAVVLGACGAVFTAFTRCAVSDWVVRLAARLYSLDPEVQGEKLEEWRRDIEEMAPAERPEHAGSLLWLAVRRLPAHVVARLSGRRQHRPVGTDSSIVVSVMSALGAVIVALSMIAVMLLLLPSLWPGLQPLRSRGRTTGIGRSSGAETFPPRLSREVTGGETLPE